MAGDLGFSLSQGQAEKMALYLELLESWNRRMNLVGPARWRDIFSELFVDSFHLAGVLGKLGRPATRCLDLGAGAGIPGIPLRMLWSEGEYVLVEIREKRVVFLRYALSRLHLPGVDVHGGKAEELLVPERPADIILSRAFMPWEELLPFTRPGLADTGTLLVMASEPWAAGHVQRLPRGWRMEGQSGYPTPRGERFFWLFSPV